MRNPTRPPSDEKIRRIAKESAAPASNIWDMPTPPPPATVTRLSRGAQKTFEERQDERLRKWRIDTFDYLKFSDEARELSALFASINRKLQQDQLSESEARREMEQLGFVMDAVSDDPSFDPLASTDWTLLQVIVWIATRSADRVRDVSADARKRKIRLRSNDRAPRFELHWRVSLQELPEQALLEDARKELWQVLRTASIAATGIDAPGVPRKAIAAIEWSDLCLMRDDVVYANARGDGYFRSSDHAYFNVRVHVADVLKNWPKQNKSSDGTARRRRGNPGVVRRRVVDEMRRDMAGGYDPEKAKGVELAAKYGAHRGTCQAALEELQMEILSVKK